MSEIWRPVVGFETKYEISDGGRLRYVEDRRVKKPRKKHKGYMAYRLHSKGDIKDIYVHRMVAEAFIGPRPHKYVVDHINEKKDDNRLENLRYITNRENTVRGKACLKREGKSSRYAGVSKVSPGKWTAASQHMGKRRYLGLFETEEEAGAAYRAFVLGIEGRI